MSSRSTLTSFGSSRFFIASTAPLTTGDSDFLAKGREIVCQSLTPIEALTYQSFRWPCIEFLGDSWL